MTNYDMDEIERKRDKEKRESEKDISPWSISDWVEFQGELYPELIRLEPREYFDKCIKGMASRANGLQVLCYDTSVILTMLQDDMGMTDEESIEHYFYNVEGSWMGEHSPVFLHRHDQTT